MTEPDMVAGQRALAVHGAVYGRNFGDLLIQALFARGLVATTATRVVLPAASPPFMRDLVGLQREFPAGDGAARAVPDAATREPGVMAGCWGPGGYFGERPYRKADWNRRLQTYHGRFMEFLRRNGLPSLVFGVSVGPFSDPVSAALVAACLRAAELVFVRDGFSRREVLALGLDEARVRVTPDLAFLLRDTDITAFMGDQAARLLGDGAGRRKIALHLDMPAPRHAAAIARMVRELGRFARANPGLDFHLVTDGQVPHPAALVRLATAGIPNLFPVDPTAPAALLGMLVRFDALLTTKLHVGLVYHVLGGLPVAVCPHPKVSHLYRDIGLEAQCHGIDDLPDGWLTDRMAAALAFRRGSLESGIDARRRLLQGDLQAVGDWLRSLPARAISHRW